MSSRLVRLGLVAAALGAVTLGTLAWFFASGRLVWDPIDEADYPVRGIDVSHHQGPIDWEQVGASGVRFAFIKATEGGDFRDRRFVENWREAGRAGVVRGAYHFFTFCTDGVAQARNFLEVVPRDRGVLPPAIDVEFTGNCEGWESIEKIRAELRRCLEHIESETGRRPLLYVTDAARRRIVDGHFPDRSLWLRNKLWRPGGERWLFWQYTDTGTVPGIRGPVDLNAYRDDAAAFARILAE